MEHEWGIMPYGMRNGRREWGLHGTTNLACIARRSSAGAERRRSLEICSGYTDNHEQFCVATFGSNQHSDDCVRDHRRNANADSELESKLNFELESLWNGLRRKFVRNAGHDDHTIRREQRGSFVGDLRGANDGP